jgi:tRNA threonylcarbamoyladenosine biosynthesis protein TsaE
MLNKSMDIKVINKAQTKQLAKVVANIIKHNKKPVSILLKGNLGAGKTTFSKYLINYIFGFSSNKLKVVSPSFGIIKNYSLKNKILNHIDLYRINSILELENLGMQEILQTSICIIEWAEKLENIEIAGDFFDIYINLDYNNYRIFSIKGSLLKNFNFSNF